MPLLAADNLHKTYVTGEARVSALAGVLVERSDARLIMLLSNVGRAIGTALFIVVGANVVLILILNFAISTINRSVLTASQG